MLEGTTEWTPHVHSTLEDVRKLMIEGTQEGTSRARAILEDEMRDGRATTEQLRMLRAICMVQDDVACLKRIASAGYKPPPQQCVCAPADPLCSCIQ